jgi:hypothetical protein
MKFKYIILIISFAFLGMPNLNAQDAQELKFTEMDKSYIVDQIKKEEIFLVF